MFMAEEKERKDEEGKGETGIGDEPNDDAEEASEMKERMLRLAAEFDNYKKRSRKELEAAEDSGKARLAKSLLPIIDEFELAVMAMNGSKDSMAKGMEMLYSNLLDTLKKAGLSEIEAKGVFDPYKHEIVLVRESEEKEGTILEVVKKGYMFNGIMIRPSSVIISKPKGAEPEAEGQTGQETKNDA